MGLLELLGLPPSPAFAKTTSPRREAAAVVADAALADMEDPVRADGPVSRAVAEWQSLTIEPIVSAIKSGHSLRLRAMAQDAEGLDLTEINHEVDWSSSDRTAITVDATGLATALPVSGGAVITAKLRGGSLEASLDLTVEFAPVLGPPVLKKIELSPASSQGMVGQGVWLKAMATYSDGPLADVTKLVSWTIPQPALLAFDAGTGFARLHGAGTFKLAATLSGVRSNEVTVIAKDPSPPPKPPAWPEKVDFKPSLSTALNLEVGQSVSFVAIATMSDGSKRDQTGELRWLADTPTVFAFPKPGLLKAIGAGEGRFTVFGDQLRQSNAAAYGSGNVFGPAPKTAPKVPATGKLTTKAARIMAENLKWLGQPGYLTFGSKVDPGALASTGQAPLDALLKMAADVIRLWWNFETLLAARQLWKGVHPKLLALLKEAATPAVGLTVKELNPAYDALVGMNDFVTDLKNRAVEANYIRKTTPFGIVEALWADRLPLEDMIGSYDEAGSLLPKLQGALRSLETKVGQLPKVVHDLKAMQAEITRRATEEAEREAKPLQLQARIVEILTMEFSSLETHFKNVKQHVDLALDHVNIEGSRQGLDQMRREAADTHARVNMFVDTLQTIGSAVLDPKSGIVAVMDLAQDLFVNYVDTDLSDKIKRLEEATSQYAIDTAYAEYKLCESDLENIKTKMANVKTLLEKNLQGLRVMEKDVNDSYDENRQPGGLSLTQLASVFEQAQAASPLPTPVQKSAEAAALKTSRLLRMVRVQNGEPLYDGGNRTILEDVRKDALRMSDEAVKAGTRIEEIKRSLMAIRAVAYEAVFSSKFNRAQQKKPTVR